MKKKINSPNFTILHNCNDKNIIQFNYTNTGRGSRCVTGSGCLKLIDYKR